jgi:dihydroorotase
MESESVAAKTGGVFTVCDMPNNSPMTITVEAFRDKVRRSEKVKDVDIRFFFGLTSSEDIGEFKKLMSDEELKKKCPGAKVFFDHSTGDMGADKEVLEEAFKVCAELNTPLVAHCEDAQINKEAHDMISSSDSDTQDVSLHSLMRPCASEAKAIADAIGFAKTYGTHLHIAHLSTELGLKLVKDAKESELTVTCEVAPHHLFLTVDDYEKLGTLGKMNPPLRTASEQQALWSGIADGTVDCISTDHAPHTLDEKNADNPLSAPSGVPGVETMLPLLLTVANGGWPHPDSDRFSDIGFRNSDIVRLCFENPNKIFNLGASDELKIKVDTDAEWVIKGSELHYKCGWTPYENWRVIGKVI